MMRYRGDTIDREHATGVTRHCDTVGLLQQVDQLLLLLADALGRLQRNLQRLIVLQEYIPYHHITPCILKILLTIYLFQVLICDFKFCIFLQTFS